MKEHYLTKNETATCSCGQEKTLQEIFCFDCGNYWASVYSSGVACFSNTNASVDAFNLAMNEYYGGDSV